MAIMVGFGELGAVDKFLMWEKPRGGNAVAVVERNGAQVRVPGAEWVSYHPEDRDVYEKLMRGESTGGTVVVITPPDEDEPTPGHCATPKNDSACTARGGTCQDGARTDSRGQVISCLCAGNAARRCKVPTSTALPPAGPAGMSTQKKLLIGGLVVAGAAALLYLQSDDSTSNQRAGGGSVDGLGCGCKHGRRR